MTVKEQIEVSFDPTDANACIDVTRACPKVLQYCARALWAEYHGMRMGRDDSSELFVAIMDLAKALNLVPYSRTGAESDAFFARLLAEAGITEGDKPKRPTIEELEAILQSDEDTPIIINADGSISTI